MRLATLLEALPEKIITGHPHIPVRRIVHDSRLVQPGDVFIAIREPSGHDGHQYIASAIHQGAAAVVQETAPTLDGVITVQVPDTNRAFALLADRQYGHPAQALTLIGITGTNGKTTVACLVESILQADGRSVGAIGTIGARLNRRPLEPHQTHTTPYPTQLQELLRKMADAHAGYVIMEVSSISLIFDRLSPLKFHAAVFTNLTRDHLDLHPSFDAYCAAKLRLFQDFLRADGIAVINTDDPMSGRFINASAGKTMTYGLSGQADITINGRIRMTPGGASFSIRTKEGKWPLLLPLLGRFNVSNALAAFGVGRALGIAPSVIIKGLSETAVVPGRMERIDEGQSFTVAVDYAHTPDALRHVLTSAREWTGGRLIVVFGCGGDRDRGKRPEMGRMAAHLSDYAIVTSDNPRTENPARILRDIEAGMNTEAHTHTAVCDRREAIAAAIEMAREGDTVIIAGKGHEDYQDIAGRRIPFDDRQVARDILKSISK